MSDMRRPSNEDTLPKAGEVRKIAYSERTDMLAVNALLPCDDTIPQITEGLEIFNVSYNMAKPGNDILVEICVTISESANTTNQVGFAVFVDGATDATAGIFTGSSSASLQGGTLNTAFKTNVGASSVNIKVRAGSEAASANVFLNKGNRDTTNLTTGNLGNRIRSWVKITEIEA